MADWAIIEWMRPRLKLGYGPGPSRSTHGLGLVEGQRGLRLTTRYIIKLTLNTKKLLN